MLANLPVFVVHDRAVLLVQQVQYLFGFQYLTF